MIIRTNEVIMISSDGSNVRTVIKIRICNVKLYSVPPDVSFTLIAGSPIWALRGRLTKDSDASKKTNRTLNPYDFLEILMLNLANLKIRL